MASRGRSSSRRTFHFDTLESRALLSGVHPGVELHSLRSTKQTIIQGTIRLQVTSDSPYDSLNEISYENFSGKGTASHIGHVMCTVREGSYIGDGDSPFNYDTATLTTS